jgi:YYY domain-containing protein
METKSLTDMLPEVLRWWLVVQAIGVVSLPLTTFAFRTLPDRGYAFSKSLGLLLVCYGAWVLSMFGLGSSGLPMLVIMSLLVGIGGGYAWFRLLRSEPPPASEGRASPVLAVVHSPVAYLKQHWGDIIVYEGIFLVALVALVWLRAHNPHPWGTERPMDFAFFNAIQQSNIFPPNDPWLAGYSINYYYFGYLMMASVSLLSGLKLSVGFNLSLALIFALTALNTAGVLSNLVALTLTARRRAAGAEQEPHQSSRPSSRLLAFGVRYVVAVVGVVLVLLAGNQAGSLQLVTGDHRVVALDGWQLVSALQQTLQGKEQIELPSPVHTNPHDFGTFTELEKRDRSEQEFNWWWPSRAVWDVHPPDHPFSTEEQPLRRYNITEFPFFSFWLGDMHPHVMSLPFTLLAMALALSLLARSTVPGFTANRVGWLELFLTGVILGSLYAINSWDLPTYVLLAIGAILLLYVRQSKYPGMLAWSALFGQIVRVLLAAYLTFLPFHLTFHSLVGSAEPLTDTPLLSSFTRMVAPVHVSRTGIHEFLIMFGLFAIPLIAFVYLVHEGKRAGGTPQSHAQPGRQPQPTGEPAHAGEQPTTADEPAHAGEQPTTADEPAHAGEQPHPQPTSQPPQRAYGGEIFDPWAIMLPWLGPVLLVVGVLMGFPMLMLVGIGGLAFYRAIQHAHKTAEAFVLLLVALGCAILVGTDIMYLRDVFDTRMNTIFKFYYQVWLLWGVASAYAVWWLVHPALSAAGSSKPRGKMPGFRLLSLAVRGGSLLLFMVLLVGGMVYPFINLRNMWEHSELVGLEGTTPRQHPAGGDAAIAWLREHAQAGSVVLEMVPSTGGSYSGEGHGGVSASTGIPTVLGWAGHERQWRGGHETAMAEIGPRQSDVDTIYRTTNPQQALDLLQKYDVTYVYVGRLERQAYPAESLAKFAQIGEVVFEEGDVTIYRVIPAGDTSG